jgi:hypothetical protein
MNLTIEQLINRAIRALNTGQPNLAALYMAKALNILEQARERAAIRAALAAMAPAFKAVREAMVGIWTAMTEAVLPVFQQFSRVVMDIADAVNAGQADFALAADQ